MSGNLTRYVFLSFQNSSQKFVVTTFERFWVSLTSIEGDEMECLVSP